MICISAFKMTESVLLISVDDSQLAADILMHPLQLLQLEPCSARPEVQEQLPLLVLSALLLVQPLWEHARLWAKACDPSLAFDITVAMCCP